MKRALLLLFLILAIAGATSWITPTKIGGTKPDGWPRYQIDKFEDGVVTCYVISGTGPGNTAVSCMRSMVY